MFLAKDYEERKQMRLAARKKVEREFDRRIVVKAYVDEIKSFEQCFVRKCLYNFYGEIL